MFLYTVSVVEEEISRNRRTSEMFGKILKWCAIGVGVFYAWVFLTAWL